MQVDIRTPASFVFKAKNRDGDVVTTNLQKFLKNIGQFIGDLHRKADWSDPIDDKVTPLHNSRKHPSFTIHLSRVHTH